MFQIDYQVKQRHIVENSSLDLEEMLVKLCKEMHEMLNRAVSDCKISSDTAVAHINIRQQKVLESRLTFKDWNEMFQAAQVKVEQMNTVEKIEKEVVLLAITKVSESICAGMMKNKVTSTNPTHVEAEEEAMKAIHQLDKAKKAAVQRLVL